MNTDLSKLKFNFDTGTLRILYFRHKAFLVPVGVICASILVFVFVVLTQASDFFAAKDQIASEQQKITTLQNNLTMLTTLSDAADNLQIATNALPAEKDFAGIVNAIATAATVTGVGVADYSFQVGTLSEKNVSAQLPTIPLVITVQAGPEGAKRFLSALSETSPLSSVVTIQSDSGATTLRLLFYYKTQAPLRVDYTVPLRPLSQANSDLLKKLSDWQAKSKKVSLPVPPSGGQGGSVSAGASSSGSLR